MATGYSGTPLFKKLGITAGSRVLAIGPPDDYLELLGDLPDGVEVSEDRSDLDHDIVHLFTNSRDELSRRLAELRNAIKLDGVIWVSWYKRAAKLPTEITEDTVRETCLPLGLVDIKVCAIDERWSGLKLVIRKELRAFRN